MPRWLSGRCEWWRWVELTLCALAWWTGAKELAVLFLGAAFIEVLIDVVEHYVKGR